MRKEYRLKSIEIQRPYADFMYLELYTKDDKYMLADSVGNVILPQSKSTTDAYNNRIQFIKRQSLTNDSLQIGKTGISDVFFTYKSIGGGNNEYQFYSVSGKPLATYNGKLTKSVYPTVYIYKDLVGYIGLVATDGRQILPNNYQSIDVDKEGICRLIQMRNGVERQGGICISNKTDIKVPCDFHYVEFCEKENSWKIQVHEYDSISNYVEGMLYNTSFLDEGQKLFECKQYAEARRYYTLNKEQVKWANFYIGASHYKEILELRNTLDLHMLQLKKSCSRNDRSIATDMRKELQFLSVKIDKAEQSLKSYIEQGQKYMKQANEILFEISESKNSLVGFEYEISMAVADLERRCAEYDKMEHEEYQRDLEIRRMDLERQKLEEQRRTREQRERELKYKQQQKSEKRAKENKENIQQNQRKIDLKSRNHGLPRYLNQ